MALKEKIKQDLLAAVKQREGESSSALRLLLAAILNREKEKRYKISQAATRQAGAGLKEEELEKESQLTDEEVIEVTFSEIKKKKEAIFLFEKGKREDLVKKEKRAIEIWQKYLPEQLSEEEIKKLTKEAIEKVGTKEPKDMGKVMAELMPQLKGKADGATVSRIVKELLGS